MGYRALGVRVRSDMHLVDYRVEAQRLIDRILVVEPVNLVALLERARLAAELRDIATLRRVLDGIGVRRATDLGESGDPDVRYILKWDVLPPNHDRKRSGPLPPPAMLRLYKLVRTAGGA